MFIFKFFYCYQTHQIHQEEFQQNLLIMINNTLLYVSDIPKYEKIEFSKPIYTKQENKNSNNNNNNNNNKISM